MNNKYLGEWRIVEMEQWDKDYIDLVVPGFISIDEDGTGSFKFGMVEAEIDCKVESFAGTEQLEFSFEGHDEGDPVSGRGWVRIDGDTMMGHIYFHLGDDSGFSAKRQQLAQGANKPFKRTGKGCGIFEQCLFA